MDFSCHVYLTKDDACKEKVVDPKWTLYVDQSLDCEDKEKGNESTGHSCPDITNMTLTT